MNDPSSISQALSCSSEPAHSTLSCTPPLFTQLIVQYSNAASKTDHVPRGVGICKPMAKKSLAKKILFDSTSVESRLLRDIRHAVLVVHVIEKRGHSGGLYIINKLHNLIFNPNHKIRFANVLLRDSFEVSTSPLLYFSHNIHYLILHLIRVL